MMFKTSLSLGLIGAALTAQGLSACASSVDDGGGTLGQSVSAESEDDGESECELPESEGGKKARTFAVYGDAPYGATATDTSQMTATPAFIQAVNADSAVSTVLHVGDIHSGKQFCTESYDRAVFDLWKSFARPLVYTPGDNEWTDCHKTGEGGGAYNATTNSIKYVLGADGLPADYAGGDPLANLALVRSIFFAHPGRTLGMASKRVLSQASCASRANPADASFVENVMWLEANVLFVAINLPGGSNNDNDIWYGTPTMSAAQSQEIADRTGADLRWLDRAFATAQKRKVAGVVILAQADMWDPEKGAAHQAAFEPYVQSLATHTAAFGKPVLLFDGDSHVFQSSNPLSAADPLASMHPGYDVANFHRIVVHGSTLPLEYLRFTVDPRANAPHGTSAYGPFSWTEVVP